MTTTEIHSLADKFLTLIKNLDYNKDSTTYYDILSVEGFDYYMVVEVRQFLHDKKLIYRLGKSVIYSKTEYRRTKSRTRRN